jgi:DNA mismatch endonuclease (patch repair protein)
MSSKRLPTQAEVAPPQSSTVRKRMQLQRERHTSPERALRKELSRLGLRYRLHVRAIRGLRREIDVAFIGQRVAVFIDGCYWHGCPEHASWPKHNSDWWRDKIQANKNRDSDTDRRLSEAGWTVIRVWEHDDPSAAAHRIRESVRARR